MASAIALTKAAGISASLSNFSLPQMPHIFIHIPWVCALETNRRISINSFVLIAAALAPNAFPAEQAIHLLVPEVLDS